MAPSQQESLALLEQYMQQNYPDVSTVGATPQHLGMTHGEKQPGGYPASLKRTLPNLPTTRNITPEDALALIAAYGEQGRGAPPAAGGRSSPTSGGVGGNIGMRELNALMQQIIASGVGKGAIAREAASKMKMPETADDMGAYAALLANNKLDKGNPMDVIVRSLAGGFVDPNSDNPFGKFGERATAAVAADEVKRKGDRDKALLEGVTGMKFGASDRASRDARAEAMNKQTGALADAAAMPYSGIEAAAKAGIPQLSQFAEINERARARSDAASRGSLPNQVREYVTTMQQYGDKRDATAIAQEFLRKAREQKPEKFDEKEVTFYRDELVRSMGDAKPERQKPILDAYTRVLEAGGTPQQAAGAARKLMQPK